MGKSTWTPADDARLVELRRDGLTYADCAERLGRTRPAITGRLGVLGARAPKSPDWSARDINRLADLIDNHVSYAEIGRRLGRTECAVILARKRHVGRGLTTANGYSLNRVALLLFGTSYLLKTVGWWVDQGWLRGHALGIGRGVGTRVVEHDDLADFLANEQHWHLLDATLIADATLRDYALDCRGGLTFLTVGQAADRLGLTSNAVNQRIHEGKLRAVRRGRGNWFVRSDWCVDVPPRERSGIPQRRYSETELDTIRADWGRRLLTEIARDLGRTSGSVHERAMRLGLPKLGGRRWVLARAERAA